MARLYVFAEGQTELTFADTLLRPHLSTLGVYPRSLLMTTARKKGKVYRGGGRHYLRAKNDILRLLKQEKGEGVFFTTMIDLYAIYPDFPRREEAEALRHVPYDRVSFLEKAFGEDIGDSRFIPYLQLHEFEAYLFADISSLSVSYELPRLAGLQAISQTQPNPELINDGPQTAPSKRIIAHLPDYEGAKTTAGPQATGRIGLRAIREKCRHFDEWLTQLEALGTEERH